MFVVVILVLSFFMLLLLFCWFCCCFCFHIILHLVVFIYQCLLALAGLGIHVWPCRSVLIACRHPKCKKGPQNPAFYFKIGSALKENSRNTGGGYRKGGNWGEPTSENTNISQGDGGGRGMGEGRREKREIEKQRERYVYIYIHGWVGYIHIYIYLYVDM